MPQAMNWIATRSIMAQSTQVLSLERPDLGLLLVPYGQSAIHLKPGFTNACNIANTPVQEGCIPQAIEFCTTALGTDPLTMISCLWAHRLQALAPCVVQSSSINDVIILAKVLTSLDIFIVCFLLCMNQLV